MPDFQIFTSQEIESLRRGGKILHECLELVSGMVKVGVTTGELDQAAEEFIRSKGGEPGFKGYRGYPASLCTSVNEQCVHGIPGDRTLEEGDIISMDCGVLLECLYTDACVTVPVGSISADAQRLLGVTKQALSEGLSVIREGTHTGDISATIQGFVEGAGFTIVKPLTGHGLGRDLHQFPDIPNFGKMGSGHVLPQNTLIAIEPIVSVSAGDVKGIGDDWTLVTNDESLSAHYEHTALVTANGCEILT